MATLTGKIVDVTSRSPDSISSITVKAPSVRVGSGTDVIVSSPAQVTFDKTTGDITISDLTGGLSWLYIEGDGWSDSIALAVTEGMITLVEAVANASGVPGIVDYIRLLADLEERIDGVAQEAVDAAAESIRWVRGRLYTQHLNSVVKPGTYSQHLASYATAENGYPDSKRGVLVVSAWDSQTEGNVHQTYIDTYSGRIWLREYAAGAWGAWKEHGSDALRVRGDLTFQTLDSVVSPGVYYQPQASRATTERNYPQNTRGVLTVYQWGNDTQLAQTYLTTFRNTLWLREQAGAGWGEWAKIGDGATSSDTPTGDTPTGNTYRREAAKTSSRLRRGGVIGTAGATPVALSFDHGYANFRDLVLPHLKRLGLPSTSAFNSGQMDASENAGVGWGELQTLAINNGVELAHHSYSHTDISDASTNVERIKNVLTGSITTAATNMPEIVADAFILPGVGGTNYDGFNGGVPDENWWSHPAGQVLMEHFPAVSAKRRGYATPMVSDEDITFGSDRLGWDSYDSALTMRQRVASLHGTGMGVKIFMHPSQIGLPDKITAEQVQETLEWLAAERDAGRVEILTNSGFAYADTSSARRLDLAQSAQWVGDTGTLALTPMFDWVRGAQVMLETTVDTDGEVTLSAASDVGGLNAAVTRTVTAGDVCRLAFAIPTSATTLTITALGGSRKLRTV